MKILKNGEDITDKLPEKLPTFKEELRSHEFWKAVRCELLASLLYVFFGCGSAAQWTNPPNQMSDIKVGFTFGLTLSVLTQCVGSISGGHFNPAVSLAMLVTRRVSILRWSVYTIVQLLGALAASAILYGMFPLDVHGCLGCTKVNHVTLGQAFGTEFMVTFTLVFTVFANSEVKRSEMGSRSLSVGLAVVIGHLFAYHATGASMNPARSLGPAVMSNTWHRHWIYWVGPLLGGILGGFTYEYTQDSGKQIQGIRRSLRRRPTQLNRSNSQASINSAGTEMTYSPALTDDFRI